MKIINVKALDGYEVKVNFDNGNAVILNLEKKVDTVRFKLIKDEENFKRVFTDGRCIYWNELTQMSVNEIILYVQVGA